MAVLLKADKTTLLDIRDRRRVAVTGTGGGESHAQARGDGPG